jgi:hypothetical protein
MTDELYNRQGVIKMKILKNDKIEFVVSYKQNGNMYQLKTTNFDYALSVFRGLNVVSFLDFKASNDLGDSSLSASLMKRDKQGNVSVIHKHYLSQIENRG